MLRPKQLMEAPIIAFADRLALSRPKFLASPVAYRKHAANQAMRFRNCVPPVGFVCWKHTGKFFAGMECMSSNLGMCLLYFIMKALKHIQQSNEFIGTGPVETLHSVSMNFSLSSSSIMSTGQYSQGFS